jgi:molybdate transport system regulatory protein
MKTSARNVLAGTVARLTPGAVNGEVVLDIGGGIEIVAIVTERSIAELGLAVGRPATALIKSSFVMLAAGQNLRTSARNHIEGVVASRTDGAVNSEIEVEAAAGKLIVATITIESAAALGLAKGVPVTVLIKAPHVILAVED